MSWLWVCAVLAHPRVVAKYCGGNGRCLLCFWIVIVNSETPYRGRSKAARLVIGCLLVVRATTCTVSVIIIFPTPGIMCDINDYLGRERLSAAAMISPARVRNSIETACPRHTRMKVEPAELSVQHNRVSLRREKLCQEVPCALYLDGRHCPRKSPTSKNKRCVGTSYVLQHFFARFVSAHSHARTSRCFVFE